MCIANKRDRGTKAFTTKINMKLMSVPLACTIECKEALKMCAFRLPPAARGIMHAVCKAHPFLHC